MKNISNGGNAVFVKQMNRTVTFYTLLQSESPLTKSEISSTTNLAFSTVSNIIKEFENEELIRDRGLSDSKGGRKATLYSLNPTAQYFFGINIQVGKMVTVLTDLMGTMIDSKSQALTPDDGPDQVVLNIVTTINGILEKNGIVLDRVGGIGLATPGPIDELRNLIVSPATMPEWRNVPLREMLQQKIQKPCFLERDANAAAQAEARFGGGQGIRDLIYIIADAGIGSGIIIDGEIYRGFYNGAGEVGHMWVSNKGPLCNCGRVGCLEMIASLSALREKVSEKTGGLVSFDQVIDLCNSKDLMAYTWLIESAEHLGRAIGNICNLLNPQMVIIGGRLPLECNEYFDMVTAYTKKQILSSYSHRITFHKAQLGELSGAVGAANIALENWIGSSY